MLKRTCAVLILCALCVLTSAEDPDERVVRTQQGPVRGRRTAAGHFAFYGIPYATAPTGPDKFKGPLPPPVWLDTFEAVDKGIICPQPKQEMLPVSLNTVEQEDCLIVNVFVPDTHSDDPLPVVVYVHGGAFVMGSGNMFGHTALLEQDIIVVNFNYRLAVHGFLCLGTEVAPGNAGLKDQVAALQWVKQNIANFGGDVENIALAGFSAGAAAVELLMLSESTAGLFHKVIPESGSAISVWAMQQDPLRLAESVATSLGLANAHDISALEKFYQTTSLGKLFSKTFMAEKNSTFGFVPCVERKIPNEKHFLTDAPLNILRSGKYKKLPLMTGFANMEGLFRINLLGLWQDEMEKDFFKYLPADLTFKDEGETMSSAKSIKNFYFNQKAVSKDTVQEYIDYFTDILFGYSTLTSAEYQSAHAPVYLYEFSYVRGNTPHPDYPNVVGANHCAQTMALADINFMPISKDNETQAVKEVVTQLWANFIKFGVPVPEVTPLLPVEWPPTTPARPLHLSIGAALELRGALLPARARMWRDVYAQHYRYPAAPAPRNVRYEL